MVIKQPYTLCKCFASCVLYCHDMHRVYSLLVSCFNTGQIYFLCWSCCCEYIDAHPYNAYLLCNICSYLLNFRSQYKRYQWPILNEIFLFHSMEYRSTISNKTAIRCHCNGLQRVVLLEHAAWMINDGHLLLYLAVKVIWYCVGYLMVI